MRGCQCYPPSGTVSSMLRVAKLQRLQSTFYFILLRFKYFLYYIYIFSVFIYFLLYILCYSYIFYIFFVIHIYSVLCIYIIFIYSFLFFLIVLFSNDFLSVTFSVLKMVDGNRNVYK